MSTTTERGLPAGPNDRRPLRATVIRWGATAGAAALLAVTGCTSAPTTVSPQATTSPPATSSSTSPSTSVITPELDASITKALATAKAPGAIVGIWKGGAHEVRGFGLADKEMKQPMQPDMFVRIASNSKSFTLTALLRQVDKGLLKLDDPIDKYVPGVPNGKTITLRQLGEMRSGLPEFVAGPFFQKLLPNPQQQWTPKELLSYSFSEPVLFKPGTFFNYSNTNTVLIGLAIEKVTGRPLKDVVRTEVIEPAGLKNTSYAEAGDIPNPHPTGYLAGLNPKTLQPTGKEIDVTNWNTSYLYAAGAIISTADDMQQWVTALNDGRLLSKESHEQQLKFVPIPGTPKGVGYGLGVIDLNGWIGHNGDMPGFSSVMYHVPASDISLIVIANTEDKVEVAGQAKSPAGLIAEVVSDTILPDNPYRLPDLPPPPAQRS